MQDKLDPLGCAMYEQHIATESPKPMSSEELRKLRVALVEGKVCWISWESDNKVKRTKFRLTENLVLQTQEADSEWRLTGIRCDRWLSWSEVREPRVFEFEHTRKSRGPHVLIEAIADGAKFHAVYTEVLEETT